MIVLLVTFWMLFTRFGADWVSVGFYLYGLILGILLISQFWTLANDIYDPRQAKRLFGLIGGGASLGGATGAAITAGLVEKLGTTTMLLVSASIMAVCLAIVVRIIRTNERAGQSDASQDGRRGKRGRRRGADAAARLAPPADHRHGDHVCRHRRRHHRTAAQHGGGRSQGPGQHRQHHRVPGAGHGLPVAHRALHPGGADEPHPSPARHRLRADDPPGQPGRLGHPHAHRRRAVDVGGGPRARHVAALHGRQDHRARSCSCRCPPT